LKEQKAREEAEKARRAEEVWRAEAAWRAEEAQKAEEERQRREAEERAKRIRREQVVSDQAHALAATEAITRMVQQGAAATEEATRRREIQLGKCPAMESSPEALEKTRGKWPCTPCLKSGSECTPQR
jgi:dTMP kinase